MSMQNFTDHIYKFLLSWFPDVREYKLSESQKKDISQLAKEKYEKWEWNYGYSPVYEIERSILIDNNKISSHIKVEKGLITALNFDTSDPYLNMVFEKLSTTLLNIQHSKSALNSVIPSGFILTPEQLSSLLF
jgi:lipoate-protein ligase A